MVVDDLYRRLPPACTPGRGPLPQGSDSALIALALAGECCSWTQETTLVRCWRERPDRFPVVLERRRFNHRRRDRAHAVDAICRGLLALLSVARDHRCASDSLPVPVMPFHRVPAAPAAATWRAAGVTFGTVPTKQQTLCGYQSHLLVTLGGMHRDLTLAPVAASDVVVGAEVPGAQAALAVLGHKGYSSAPLAAAPRAERGALLTVPRRNQRHQLPVATARPRNGARQIVATVSDQPTAQFGLARHHSHTFRGICTRLHAKLTAHTLRLYLHRLTERAD